MDNQVKDGKLMAAISAAVFSYIRLQEASGREKVPDRRPVGAWSHHGRQEQMNIRLMWQRRLAK